jgi:hypothetical protein
VLGSHQVAEGLRVINARNVLRKGETGIITIQGQPGKKYEIKTSYKITNRTVTVTQWRVTDSNGFATFNWVVGMDTVAGTYSGQIRGNGSSINITHTVLQ